MSREFYMGDSFNRGYNEMEDADSWSPMCFLNSSATSKSVAANNSRTVGISNRLDKIESSFDKICGSCVNFAANVDEAREAFKKMAESLNKMGVGLRLCRTDLKTLGGNGRYV